MKTKETRALFFPPLFRFAVDSRISRRNPPVKQTSAHCETRYAPYVSTCTHTHTHTAEIRPAFEFIYTESENRRRLHVHVTTGRRRLSYATDDALTAYRRRSQPPRGRRTRACTSGAEAVLIIIIVSVRIATVTC